MNSPQKSVGGTAPAQRPAQAPAPQPIPTAPPSRSFERLDPIGRREGFLRDILGLSARAKHFKQMIKPAIAEYGQRKNQIRKKYRVMQRKAKSSMDHNKPDYFRKFGVSSMEQRDRPEWARKKVFRGIEKHKSSELRTLKRQHHQKVAEVREQLTEQQKQYDRNRLLGV